MFKTVVAATALTTFLAGYGVLDRTAPALTSSADQLLREHLLGYSKESCERHPAACLANQGRKLATMAGEVDTSLDGLREEAVRTEMLLADRRRQLAQNALFLEKGRELLTRAEGGARGWPVEFAGRAYENRAVLEDQLHLLWQEGQSMRTTIESMEGLRGELRERERVLQIRRGEIQDELAVIPARQQQLRSRRLLDGFAETASEIASLIERTKEGLERTGPLIGTTADLRARAERAPAAEAPVGDAAFQKWLRRDEG